MNWNPNCIEQREDGWIFWNEVWSDFYGPYPTKEECMKKLELYLSHLELGFLSDESLEDREPR